MAHLQRVPPGDHLTQWLLAQACCLLYQGLLGSKDAPARTPYDFAPWLRTSEIRRKVEHYSQDPNQQAVLERTLGG